MSRAEERAREAFPYQGGIKGMICDNSIPIYIQGYEQAEKDFMDKAEKYFRTHFKNDDMDSLGFTIQEFKEYVI